jgi:hypothetical protein
MVSNFLVTSSVNAVPPVATYSLTTSHKKNETEAEAINIGNLDQEASIISISDKGTATTSPVSTQFTAEAGVVSLSESFSSFVDKAYTSFQLTDSSGTVIADSGGTTAQQAAYEEWVAGTLQVAAGTYTATATPNTSVITSEPLTVGATEQQGTSLEVKSSLTGSDTNEYYKFSLSGNNIKLNFNASNDSNSARVLLLDKNGNVVADSDGNTYQKSNYAALTSGTGLTATSGDYTVEVTYAPNADTTQNLNYTMNLYSGSSYAVVYNNTVKAQPYDNSAAGSVTAASNAELYTTSAYNEITTSASAAVNIGWMQQDKSMLDVYSELTSADNADYYSFVFEQGDNLKLGFNSSTTPDVSGLRVQLMNSTGTEVIADNEGTEAQQEAYKELTTSSGIQASTGTYVVKISYAAGATKSDTPYEFGIYSGSTYAAEYKTTASAETYANALLLGQVSGTSASTGIAAYLTALSNGDTTDSLSQALQSVV